MKDEIEALTLSILQKAKAVSKEEFGCTLLAVDQILAGKNDSLILIKLKGL